MLASTYPLQREDILRKTGLQENTVLSIVSFPMDER